MKYRDVIHFERPQKIVQLVSSREADVARALVSTFVISDRMADVLTLVAFPQLQFDDPNDNKALLVVGNYGTGKSHLLSLIAGIAENPALVPQLRHARVREKAGSIAGRFQVLRLELGSTHMELRTAICEKLQSWLQEQGIHFVFKAMDKVSENKAELGRMMTAFHQRFPDHGLLVVVDELLDYLRSRKSQELTLDLGFLREIGEVCRDLRLRFIAGLQESLFESQEFQFAADSLNRVKDRFAQFRIAREDLAYVVSERLLQKDTAQKDAVRQHLSRFTHLFGNMQEKLENYVNLFPIHPSYLETFDRVRTGEKRQALESISNAMTALLDQDIPTDQPGLIAYDSYWLEIKENAGYRADPAIGKVIKCEETIEARVTSGFTNPVLKRMIGPAHRILHGLAVQRLTDGDIFAPVGVNAEQLRDELCLTIPGMPVKDAAFLKTSVETVLREILKIVSGQFISHNPDNGQYYLDIHKDIDFDAQINARAETLGDDVLDRYYYQALTNVMECSRETYVGGYQIWEHEIEWREHKVGRPGYLFFGTPKQRDTAHPPREFYLYFLQPFSAHQGEDNQRADEVFVRLTRRDEKFNQAIKLYAAASELAHSAGGHRQKYDEKASTYLKAVTAWLREFIPTAADVSYQGTTRKLIEWSRSGSGSRGTLRDLINGVASVCLGQHFAEQLPDYPRFSTLITRENRRQATVEAVAWLAGVKKNTPMGRAMLEGLEMLEGDHLRVLDHKDPSRGSRYATYYYNALMKKGSGQVLNRSEIMESKFNGAVQFDQRFHLEPELLAVVLVSEVAVENVTLALAGKKYDATALPELAKVNMAELTEFKHLERPREYDIGALRELFKLMELNEGLAMSLAQGSTETQIAAVQQLQERVKEWISRTLAARQALQGGLVLWDIPLISPTEKTEQLALLERLKGFLEAIEGLNAPARFKNLKYSAPEIAAFHPCISQVKQLEALARLIGQLAPKLSYLQSAKAALPPDHAWGEGYESTRHTLLAGLKIPKQRQDPEFHRQIGEQLEQLKSTYQTLYLEFHARLRLGKKDNDHRAKLLTAPRLQQLRALTGITQLPASQLDTLVGGLASLKTCASLTPHELNDSPLCPHDKFSPASEHTLPPARERLDSCDLLLTALLKGWTEKLLSELQDPIVEERLPLLSPAHRQRITQFLTEKSLPDPVDAGFVAAVNEALADLIPVVLKESRLVASLNGGAAMTVERFRQRFEALVTELTKGHDPKKVRIVVEE